MLADRLDQSRIEIVSGGNVVFKGGAAGAGSLTIAQGGQVAVSAAGRIFAERGATIDVSGVRDVSLAMSANNIMVNIQGNELRDSPVNRDSNALKNADVWVDIRDLVYVPSGTGGYAGDRYYTPGGLLEVGGYLASTQHKIGEWSAVGGTITLAAPEVVAQVGSVFDISGGSIRYEAGNIRTTNFLGPDGRLYNINNARADMTFYGLGEGFIRKHERWNVTEVWTSPFGKGRESVRWEEGYTVGRDAGRLILSTPTAIFEGDIVADVVQGERQNSARPDGVVDGYKVAQNVVAQAGTLALGQYTAVGLTELYTTDVRIGDIAGVTAALASADALPDGRANTAWFDADYLNAQGLGGLELGTRGAIAIDAPLTLADGGSVKLIAPVIDIKADVTARSGSVNATNLFTAAGPSGSEMALVLNGGATVALRDGAVIDVGGAWTNAVADGDDRNGLAFRDGGSVSLQSTRDVTIEEGAQIDASSGASIEVKGGFKGGKGGNVSLLADALGAGNGRLTLNGAVRGYGAAGGGKLAIESGPTIIIGGTPDAAVLNLNSTLFRTGFAQYDVIGHKGVTVAGGATIDVMMPSYRMRAGAYAVAIGGDPSTALELWTAPLYLPNAAGDRLVQRTGAGLLLQAGTNASSVADMASVGLDVARSAVINVDPGQAIKLQSIGQLTVDATLNAWGGNITLASVVAGGADGQNANAAGHGRSIWLGDHAVLDVASRAVTALDLRGRRYGIVANGGSITIGGVIDHTTGLATGPDLFVVVREGARLDASGAQATLDISGQGATAVASNGGSISLTSNNGLYLDGSFTAKAGGATAAGGTLSVGLLSPDYPRATASAGVLLPRELIVAQDRGGSALQGLDDPAAASSSLIYGRARLSVSQIASGGFDNLALLGSNVSFAGDTDLTLRQSLQIYTTGLSLAADASLMSRVHLASSYLRLASYFPAGRDGYVQPLGLTNPSSLSGKATFTADADLIDVRGLVGFGARGPSGAMVPVFDQVTLTSRGDLRFLAFGMPSNNGQPTTGLDSPGDMTLLAAQLYPTTGAVAGVTAGGINGRLDPLRGLTIGRSTTEMPELPYSAFGSLRLAAAHVVQGGVVRAPLGHLEFGLNGSGLQTTSVDFLAGSLTSVSGAGLMMPYGGTIDGQVWNYAGSPVSFTGVGGSRANGTLASGVALNAQAVDVQAGAVLDLLGGGTLTGVGFVSGRGGSVDVLRYALADSNPGYGYSKSGNQVYAIIPGHVAAYAPVSPDAGARDPAIGRQITLDGSTPGLPAGTYTLMPSTYALLPGAFRVELAGADPRGLSVSASLPNGSFIAAAHLGVANTGISESLARQVILTPGTVARTHSLYDETGYADFAIADAARRGIPRPMLPVDGKSLKFNVIAGAGANSLTFDGAGLFAAATGGFDGSASIIANSIEVVASGRQATPGFTGVTVVADELNAIGASRLAIGGLQFVEYGQGGNYVRSATGVAQYVYLRSGAVLSAPEVFLVAQDPINPEQGDGLIRIEQGASINTLARGNVAFDSNDGFIYAPEGSHFVAVSNGLINVAPSTNVARGGIDIGNCVLSTCSGDTTLYSKGTIVLSTTGNFDLSNAVRYGTRNLSLAVGGINVGSTQSLADAAARGILPAGLILNQSVLNRLIAGDTSTGAPALESLILSAAGSMNFFGDVALDTYDPVTGQSTLDRLVLTTPAIYGYGNAGTVASIRTKNLVFGGSLNQASAVVTNGAGTGSGALNLQAEVMEFGFGPFTQPSNVKSYDRLMLGFANVTLSASDRITANHKGSLAVYQAQGAYTPGTGYAYSGGNLTIVTPLFTGAAGSVNNIVAGGTVSVTSPGDASPGTVAVDADALGAQLSLSGTNIVLASSVVLPSGKLTLSATYDITLNDAARIDMAGRTIVFNDIAKSSWGGDVLLESSNGNILQAAGSTIDLSAKFNVAGTLSAVALNAAAGTVDLQGSILGSSSGTYDAGGTYMPYKAASVEIRAQHLGGVGTLSDQFAALNQRLNAGQVFGGRSFQLKQGDLVIGDGLKAGSVDVSLDGGQLTVTGTIDASGASVGSIYLAANNGLTLAGSAVLDAHGEILRVDSYGKIIDSPNRAIVDLSSGNGVLTLAAGARIDLRHGTAASFGSAAGQNDGIARGTIELNAPRIGSGGNVTDADAATYGDIAINASGPVTIQGARSIAVNAMQRYTDVPDGTDAAVSGRPYQVITQGWLDGKHAEATLFIDAALGRASVMSGKLAGLNNDVYRNAFHLRPGIEIASKTADGDLVIQGDLDLSGYRYNGVNPNFVRTGVYGSGEVGTLRLRAGGDLSIYGSINDGFAPPPLTQDDNGWVLLPGIDFTGGDIVVPGIGVTLADGTAFPNGATLNYDLPVKGAGFDAGMRLPSSAKLSAAITVPAGTVLAAAVRDGAGNILYAAGTLLSEATTLPIGTQLDAGSVMPVSFAVSAFVWPKGVPLSAPVRSTDPRAAMFLLDGALALKPGSLIPSGTDIKLPAGVDSVQLRPEVAGRQGGIWAVAPMLPDGSQSWSLRFVAGADLDAADGRRVQSHPAHGDIRLADSHYGLYGKQLPGGEIWTQAAADELGMPELVGRPMTDQDVQDIVGYPSVAALCVDAGYWCGAGPTTTYALTPGSTRPSVIRTGTGDLQFFTGGDLRMDSLYGVYTAGTSSVPTSANDPYDQQRARLMGHTTVLGDANGSYEKLVDGGSDSVYRAWYPDLGGDLTLKIGGDLTGNVMNRSQSVASRPNILDSGYDTADVANWLWRQGSGSVATGGQAQPTAWWINFGTYVGAMDGYVPYADKMIGFTGLGTLGGGNLSVEVAGNAGRVSTLAANTFDPNYNARSQGLVLAVGNTGRVAADGSIQFTGGGDLSLRVGGVLNPEVGDSTAHLNGTITNLRGRAEVKASDIGAIDLTYGNSRDTNTPKETRAFDPFTATRGLPNGGPSLMPGDATFSLSTLRDLVLKDVSDPGRVALVNASPFSFGGVTGKGLSWFTLWTDHTAIDMFSAGGNVTPYTASSNLTDDAAVYPSIVRAVAATGSLYYGRAARSWQSDAGEIESLLLAPSPRSELQFLAGGSIYAGGFSVSQSSAAAESCFRGLAAKCLPGHSLGQQPVPIGQQVDRVHLPAVCLWLRVGGGAGQCRVRTGTVLRLDRRSRRCLYGAHYQPRRQWWFPGSGISVRHRLVRGRSGGTDDRRARYRQQR
ncbi:beta strand repeat-containing protein [Bradyrhizobium cenepequi]|uniref:beta strand repeat-containing protein n=1 Tax=Bradyrhizobium cenepequi TaxID=2821403 RepID=UPI001CE2BBFA|nr:filamentous hemagglutinin [Bradyrhizobium cenepequi]MCA6112223.1 filamentous hemagglutinin [Bradyrhizobium cenepequi]